MYSSVAQERLLHAADVIQEVCNGARLPWASVPDYSYLPRVMVTAIRLHPSFYEPLIQLTSTPSSREIELQDGCQQNSIA
jgi:hypothetical protein